MKKISYFDGCKKNYIDTLEIDNSIQTKWTNLKNTYSKELQILPFDIKEIIKASYKTLVEYFIEINKLKKKVFILQ